MLNNGIKIKELARELGVTSRQLIDKCRENGIDAQNSITRIHPRDLPRVRALFSEGTSSEPQRDIG